MDKVVGYADRGRPYRYKISLNAGGTTVVVPRDLFFCNNKLNKNTTCGRYR